MERIYDDIYIYIWGSNEAPRMILGYHRGRLVTYPQYPAVFSNLLLQGPAMPRAGMSTFLAIMALFRTFLTFFIALYIFIARLSDTWFHFDVLAHLMRIVRVYHVYISIFWNWFMDGRNCIKLSSYAICSCQFPLALRSCFARRMDSPTYQIEILFLSSLCVCVCLRGWDSSSNGTVYWP